MQLCITHILLIHFALDSTNKIHECLGNEKMHQSYSNLWYIGKVGSQFCGNMPQNCDLNTFFKSHLLSRSATVYLFILQQLFWLHLSAEKCQHSRTCVFSITVCFARLTPLWEYPLNHVLRRC